MLARPVGALRHGQDYPTRSLLWRGYGPPTATACVRACARARACCAKGVAAKAVVLAARQRWRCSSATHRSQALCHVLPGDAKRASHIARPVYLQRATNLDRAAVGFHARVAFVCGVWVGGWVHGARGARACVVRVARVQSGTHTGGRHRGERTWWVGVACAHTRWPFVGAAPAGPGATACSSTACAVRKV